MPEFILRSVISQETIPVWCFLGFLSPKFCPVSILFCEMFQNVCLSHTNGFDHILVIL